MTDPLETQIARLNDRLTKIHTRDDEHIYNLLKELQQWRAYGIGQGITPEVMIALKNLMGAKE